MVDLVEMMVELSAPRPLLRRVGGRTVYVNAQHALATKGTVKREDFRLSKHVPCPRVLG
jgi:hypothetical protein